MAKENDEVQHNITNNNNSNCSSRNSNNNGMDTHSVTLPSSDDAATEPTTKKLTTDILLADVAATAENRSKYTDISSGVDGDCASSSSATYMRGKLNDLVADLCMNAPMDGGGENKNGGGYSDYTNGVAGTETTVPQKANSSAPQHTSQPTQNASSFSFKHFLSSGPPMTAPSSTVTVTTLDATAPASSSNSVNGSQSINSITAAPASIGGGTTQQQTSTGARPKVPQSTSLSSTSISSLSATTGGSGGGLQDGCNNFGTSATKMKRSPRFSSFDSQASLAEYVTVEEVADVDNTTSMAGSGVRGSGVSGTTGFRLYTENFFTPSPRASRRLVESGDGAGISSNQYVPRSYSNYEMPMSSLTASPRRCVIVTNLNNTCGGSGGTTRDGRPTRLALNTNTSKSKVNFPLDGDMTIGACGGGGGGSTASVAAAPPVTRPLPSNAGEFAAAALPDFVQDHWLDSWYAHDMHLNSPPNSPTRDFSDLDVAGGAVGCSGTGGNDGATSGGIGVNSNTCDLASGGGIGGLGIPRASPTYGGGSGVGVLASGVAGGGVRDGGVGGESSSTAEATASNAKMLPDFLSDGPIIHSSQRLADVTVGLPSNSIGSPGDPPIPIQLARLRIENERLQRELNDARVALNEQTRRANDLERQLQMRVHVEEAAAGTASVAAESEAAEVGKRQLPKQQPTQSYLLKLKQQVSQLTSEMEELRRENESLREEGAVGGFNAAYCDRARPSAMANAVGGAAAGVAAAAGARAAAAAAVGRPSRTQQISRDLLKAATNAENNLRQLLAGVDNLRQMAADIDNAGELHLGGYDVSPDLFSDFLDDCDDFEDYSDGPTL